MTDFQTRVGRWGERSFPQSTIRSIAAHLTEECGELAEACEGWQHQTECGLDLVASSYADQIREEAADVLLILQHLAHRLEFDLAAAAEEKFEICRRRKWEMDPKRGYAKHVEEGAPR